MNLTHLFNKDFFIQNIKKSKASIIFISLLLPLFTFLMITSWRADSSFITEFWNVSIFNIMLMYIIPIALSMSLFSFCFKKQSADFIGSMPISRKSIFSTNTIGGIIIIVLIQIVTALMTLVVSKVLSNTVVFGAMIWDSFLFFTIAYIFVFACSNLAVSFSGNMFASIASTLLIMFLIPFILFSAKLDLLFKGEYDNVIVENHELTYFEHSNYTIPSLIFDSFENQSEYDYNTISMLKTLALAVIYIVVGTYIFNRKKYETAGESYENDKIHLIIKLLTFTPFMLIGINMQIFDISFLFFIAFMGVYYFIFDLITNKKIKFKVALPTFIASFAIMYCFFDFIVPKLGFMNKRTIDISDIKEITIDEISFNYSDTFDFGLKIDDEDLINDLLMEEVANYSSSSYTYYSNTQRLSLKTKNGNIIKINKYFKNGIENILKKYGNEPYEFKHYDFVPYLTAIKLTKEDENSIREALKLDLNNITYREYYDAISSKDRLYELKFYGYNNHKLVQNYMGTQDFKNLTNICVKLMNKNAYLGGSRYDNWYVRNDDALRKLIKAKNNNLHFVSELKNEDNMDKTIDNIFEVAVNELSNEDVKEFLKKHKDDDFSFDKNYFILSGIMSGKSFYSNNLEDFYKLLAKTYNNSEEAKRINIILNDN